MASSLRVLCKFKKARTASCLCKGHGSPTWQVCMYVVYVCTFMAGILSSDEVSLLGDVKRGNDLWYRLRVVVKIIVVVDNAGKFISWGKLFATLIAVWVVIVVVFGFIDGRWR